MKATMILKNLLIFAAGAAIGAIATYKMVKDSFEASTQEEIDEMREYYRQKSEDDSETPDLVDEEEPCEMTEAQYHERYKNVATLYNPSAEMDDDHNIDNEPEEVNVVPIGERNPTPYIISSDDFAETNAYDKLTFVYYEEDDTLADESEEIVRDIDGTIGEALVSFGKNSGDPDIVYVRNERICIDYEVIREKKSYQTTILGLGFSVKGTPSKKSAPKEEDR